MSADASVVRFMLDDREIEASPAESLLAVAKRHGIELPHLCAKDDLRPVGNCRACVVEIDGSRALVPSCCRMPEPGMIVHTDRPRAHRARTMVLELLLAEAPGQAEDSELLFWCKKLGVVGRRFAALTPLAVQDDSHPAIAVRLDACIRCTRCVRACREVQVNDVIGMTLRGAQATIAFDFAASLGTSSCVGCGECVAACPTGALRLAKNKPAEDKTNRVEIAPTQVATRIASLCPYCGVGCQVDYHVEGPTVVAATGRNGPANAGRLCVKGRFGYDYARHGARLTLPLIRRHDAKKDPSLKGTSEDWRGAFREASWTEALDFATEGLLRVKRECGRHALAGFGSAKGSNEEAYLFQKLVRLGFGNHNVDHCTRLCHASSVTALLEGIGSGAVSNPVRDVQYAQVIVVIGANPTVNHPVAASFIKNAAQRGATLIVLDPRETELARHAAHFLKFRSDTDVPLLMSLLHVIVFEHLVDADFIRMRVDGFDDAFRTNLQCYAPEAVSAVVGIPAATLRTVARIYAKASAAMIFWGMGVAQHTHGTDNVRCLIALALLTGQIGRRGAGLHPLRGQNNVQGASDAGLVPMMLPDYRRVADPIERARLEVLWGAPLDDKPGLTVVEIMNAAQRREVRAMLVAGENPAMSDPDLNHSRAALASLDHLVVQDIFLTETAALADVILPATSFFEKSGSFTNTDRLVQLARPVLPPPGQAQQDLWIIEELGRRLGLPWRYGTAEAVFEEMRRVMPSIAGIGWHRLQDEGAVTSPCPSADMPGQPVLFIERFPTPNGRGRIFPVARRPAVELPDADYPWTLITGRQLEHWHTGTMTRRSHVLSALQPVAYVNVHPEDLALLGTCDGARITLETRRGRITAAARVDAGLARGTVFMPFCYVEAAANLLTHSALDPDAKIPGFKYCAVRASALAAIPEPV